MIKNFCDICHKEIPNDKEGSWIEIHSGSLDYNNVEFDVCYECLDDLMKIVSSPIEKIKYEKIHPCKSMLLKIKEGVDKWLDI